jgi:regulator of RNase E activity RraA
VGRSFQRDRLRCGGLSWGALILVEVVVRPGIHLVGDWLGVVVVDMVDRFILDLDYLG